MVSQQNIVPDEIVCKIFCFLSTQDVVRLRAVSKRFRDITYDLSIWKALYANAPLPRPPGPFPFQSPRFLEATLVQSARLAQHWTTHVIQYQSSIEIPLERPNEPVIPIHGQWLLTCDLSDQITLQNIETGSRQVLWKPDDRIGSWSACSMMSSSELLVYILLAEPTDDPLHPSRVVWKLIEIRLNGHSGQLHGTTSFIIPKMRDQLYTSLYDNNAPFIRISGVDLIFDNRTRLFYKFPERSTELNVRLPESPIGRIVRLTGTHVLTLTETIETPHRVGTLIQIFIVPDDPASAQDSDGTGVLRLSHESVVDGSFHELVRARNSRVDPLTGSTSLRFLCQMNTDSDDLRIYCIDITLPKPRRSSVLPIDVNTYFVLKAFEPNPHLTPTGEGYFYFHTSDDGHIRGVYCTQMTQRVSGTKNRDISVVKFTIDGTGDKCVGVVGEPSPPGGTQVHNMWMYYLRIFDGVRGRVLYLEDGSSVLRVMDIK